MFERFTRDELKIILFLLYNYQDGGSKWAIDGIWLNDIKKKIEEMQEELRWVVIEHQ